MTYDEALKKLEDLTTQMERGDVPIDTLAKQLREAQEMIAFCRQQLTQVDEEIKKILQTSTL